VVFSDDDVFGRLAPVEEAELEMLESAADQASNGDPDVVEEILKNFRLACRVEITVEMSGIEINLPDDVTNMLEVPLWMRTR